MPILRRGAFGRIRAKGASTPASLTHGSSYTITGSGFGTKATAAPALREDFADLTLAENLHISGNETMITNNTNNLRTGLVPYNARCDFGKNGDWFGYTAQTSAKWFYAYWFKLASNWTWGDDYERRANIKLCRFYPTGLGTTDLGYAFHGWVGTNNVCYFGESDTSVDHYFGNGITLFTLDTWHRFAIEYGENSGVGATDGHMRWWLDGTLLDTSDTLNTNFTEDGAAKNKFPSLIGWYDSWTGYPEDGPMYMYIDDIYVDTCWSRVEIGDNASYGACTHYEVQVPTAWSDTSVTFTVNRGSFAPSSSVYVHITNASGTRQAIGPLSIT